MGKKSDDYVFARDGRPVKDFRHAWWTACQKAGLGRFVKEKDRKRRVGEEVAGSRSP
jgi:hypothetical protein